jgi:hypothetical protein
VPVPTVKRTVEPHERLGVPDDVVVVGSASTVMQLQVLKTLQVLKKLQAVEKVARRDDVQVTEPLIFSQLNFKTKTRKEKFATSRFSPGVG